MDFRIKLWGIRGSLPAPHPPDELREILLHMLQLYEEKRSELKSPHEFLEQLNPPFRGGFGGHTSCVQVSSGEDHLIIDCGSGIRPLGERLLLTELGKGKGEAHILLTHFHWDHLIGIPFFIPIFIPGNQIHFYGVQDDLEKNIRMMFQKPNFPVDYGDLGADIHFHQLEPRKPKAFKNIQVTPYELDHPDPCWGYRFDCAGKSFAHCVDSEMTRVSPSDLGDDIGLYQNVDLAVMDAQYTFVEATERINWGHASAPVGLDLAMREGIKRTLFVHHDPAASDVKIQQLEKQTREYYEAALKTFVARADPIMRWNGSLPKKVWKSSWLRNIDMSFEFKISENVTDGILIEFFGDIDESADFSKIKIPEGNRLTLSLKGIRILNSVGLRSWVLWIKKLQQEVVVLLKCPAVAVHQMNILNGFIPLRSIVQSFEVTYHCESCGKEESVWLERGKDFYERTADAAEWVNVEKTKKCIHCGEECELDIIPGKYFHFLKSPR